MNVSSLDLARDLRAPPPGGPDGAPPRGERGAVSWVTLLLLALAVGGGYLGWVWGPIYVENYAVKQVVRDYMNQAIKNRDDAWLQRNMVLKIQSLALVRGVDAYGQPAQVPAIQVDERSVSWERNLDSQPPMLRVSLVYTREVEYPYLDRTVTKVFELDLTNDLTAPNWGPGR